MGTSALNHIDDLAGNYDMRYRLTHRKLKSIDEDKKILTFMLFYEEI